MGKLKPIIINIKSTSGGSVEDCIKFYNRIKKYNKQGREVVVNIDSAYIGTIAKWQG